jgi:polyhydroxyalkanoate synthesis regulator phasin
MEMSVQVLISVISLGLAIAVHAFATVWWAAKLTYSLEGIQREIKEINQDLKENTLETKLQMQAVWKRHDELKDRVLKLETER